MGVSNNCNTFSLRNIHLQFKFFISPVSLVLFLIFIFVTKFTSVSKVPWSPLICAGWLIHGSLSRKIILERKNHLLLGSHIGPLLPQIYAESMRCVTFLCRSWKPSRIMFARSAITLLRFSQSSRVMFSDMADKSWNTSSDTIWYSHAFKNSEMVRRRSTKRRVK